MPSLWNKLAGRKPHPEPPPTPDAPPGAQDGASGQPGAPSRHVPEPPPTKPALPNVASGPDDLLAPAQSTPSRRSWRDRLSSSGFARGLSSLFSRNPVLSDDLLDELEKKGTR